MRSMSGLKEFRNEISGQNYNSITIIPPLLLLSMQQTMSNRKIRIVGGYDASAGQPLDVLEGV